MTPGKFNDTVPPNPLRATENSLVGMHPPAVEAPLFAYALQGPRLGHRVHQKVLRVSGGRTTSDASNSGDKEGSCSSNPSLHGF